MNLEEYKSKFNFREVHTCDTCKWVSMNHSVCRHPDCPYQELPFGGAVNMIDLQTLRVIDFIDKDRHFACDNWEGWK